MENDGFYDKNDTYLSAVIIHENEPKKFTVSSNALRLASPVWEKMIDPLLSGENGEVKQLGLLDFTMVDNRALFILSIAHLQKWKVPKRLDYKTLLQVAVLCDRYNCLRIVQPWLEGWMYDQVGESTWMARRIGCLLLGSLGIII